MCMCVFMDVIRALSHCCPPAKYVVSAFGVVLWCCMNVVRINVHVCVCVGSVRISSQRHDMFVCVCI